VWKTTKLIEGGHRGLRDIRYYSLDFEKKRKKLFLRFFSKSKKSRLFYVFCRVSYVFSNYRRPIMCTNNADGLVSFIAKVAKQYGTNKRCELKADKQEVRSDSLRSCLHQKCGETVPLQRTKPAKFTLAEDWSRPLLVHREPISPRRRDATRRDVLMVGGVYCFHFEVHFLYFCLSSVASNFTFTRHNTHHKLDSTSTIESAVLMFFMRQTVLLCNPSFSHLLV